MEVETIIKKMTDSIDAEIRGIDDQSKIKWEHLSKICTYSSVCANSLSLTTKEEVPYGRYMVFQNKLFNVQLDIFSKSYIGAPHNHDTWGVMSVISGYLGITDYLLENDKLKTIRTGILRSGASVSFKQESDWHSTETFEAPQVASFHIYGKNFNLNEGLRHKKGLGLERYERGDLRHYDVSSNILRVKNTD